MDGHHIAIGLRKCLIKFRKWYQVQGKYAFMHVYNMGSSKNYRNSNVVAAGGAIGTIAKIGGLLGGVNAKLQAEEQYYTILANILANCCGV